MVNTQVESNVQVFVWDHKEDAPVADIVRYVVEVLGGISGVYARMVPDPGGDDYVCVVADHEVSDEEALDLLHTDSDEITPELVQVHISKDHDTAPCDDPETAAEAVRVVLGEGRHIEATDAEIGLWLVQMTTLEIEVLEEQRYLDLEKGPFRIRAEMP